MPVATSQDDHGVAIRVEAITPCHSVPVGARSQFAAGKGTNEHQKGGAWQVEVGEKTVHHTKSVPRGDHQTGLPAARVDGAVVAGGAFQGPHHGGSHRPYPPTMFSYPLDQRRQTWRYLVGLRMHGVL